jgi:hypothetical protein
MEAFLARPDGEGRYPTIVIIHELFGLNDNMRDISCGRQLRERVRLWAATHSRTSRLAPAAFFEQHLAGGANLA